MADLKMQAFQEFTEAYKQYSTVGGVANPAATTHQMMQALFDNWSASMYRMIQMYWQPKHEYKAGSVAWTATLPAGTIAKCTKAGITAEAEPAWPKIVGGTATDGSVEWKLVVMCPEELPAKGGTADLAKNAEKLGGHLPAYFVTADNLDLKAPLASPAFTGTPTAPTAEKTTNNTQLATTAFVHSVADGARVVEFYRNDTEWYRVWSDGWLEQGGEQIFAAYDKGGSTVTFLKPFSNKPTITVGMDMEGGASNSTNYKTLKIKDRTNISFTAGGREYGGSSTVLGMWYVCGQGA